MKQREFLKQALPRVLYGRIYRRIGLVLSVELKKVSLIKRSRPVLLKERNECDED
jgi:hypothetical protein